MNIRTVGIIFILSVLLLLTFQAVWLYNTYCLEKERVQINLNTLLQECIKSEMLIRFDKEQNRENEDDIQIHIGIEDVLEEDFSDDSMITINVEESFNNAPLQYVLVLAGFPFDLHQLDSLFQRKLTESNYQLDYLICYSDSTNQLLDSIGKPLLNYAAGVFASDSIPIVNKSYVHLFADISMPVVLKQMVGLTIASFLMLVILIIALIIQIRYAYNQYRLNQLREDFSNALIHDLKSPLNAIFIALSNFKNGTFAKNPEFGRQVVNIAIDQVLNIQTLVDRVLTIARLESKNMEVDRSQTDLPGIIHKLTERYLLVAQKEVAFETTFELPDTPVFIDGALVEQAISNLIDNAIKYSGAAVTICISAEIKEEKLFIYVKDDGFGISTKDQEKIFNKFERGAAVFRKGGAKGFGLGLSYVRQVAIAHQGTIALSSVKNEGSEFVLVLGLLFLPLNEQEETTNIDQRNENH